MFYERKNQKHLCFGVIFVIVALFVFSSCSQLQSPQSTPGTEPTATQSPSLAGENFNESDCVISASYINTQIKNTFGDRASELVFCEFGTENKLYAAATGEDFDMLYCFDATSSQLLASYTLPFRYYESQAFCNQNVFNVIDNGNIAVFDGKGNSFTILTPEFTEYARYTDVFSPEAYENIIQGDIMTEIVYDYHANLLYYSGDFDNPDICVIDLNSGNTSIFFSSPYEGDRLDGITLTDDGKYIMTKSVDYSFSTPTERISDVEYYIIDTATSEIIESSYINCMLYSNGNKRATCKYNYYTSDFVYNDVKTDITYLEEYENIIVNFDEEIVATAIPIDTSELHRTMLSIYDLNTGKLTARTFIVSDNSIYSYKYTFNTDGAKALCSLSSFWSDGGPSYDVPILFMYDKADIEVDKLAEDTLTPCKNTQVVDLDLYRSSLEKKYDVSIKYGASLYEYINEHDIGTTVVESFDDSSDKQYIFECLCVLDEAFSAYPDGMLKKLSELDDGIPVILICTYLDNPNYEFDISGEYISFGTGQHIALQFRPNSISDFSITDSVSSFRGVVHHELCHAFQRYFFELDSKDSLYDLDTWLSYLPEGYYYGSEEEQSYSYSTDTDNLYFVDTYAMTGMLEDMSRLFEHAMWDEIPECLYYKNIAPRYKYLCEIIRAAFGDETWSDVMPWERAAQNRS